MGRHGLFVRPVGESAIKSCVVCHRLDIISGDFDGIAVVSFAVSSGETSAAHVLYGGVFAVLYAKETIPSQEIDKVNRNRKDKMCVFT